MTTSLLFQDYFFWQDLVFLKPHHFDKHRLFKKHRKVKIKVDNLEKYIKSKTKDLRDASSKKFLDELVGLSMKIRYCAAKIMTSNFISRVWEYLLIFINSRKQ